MIYRIGNDPTVSVPPTRVRDMVSLGKVIRARRKDMGITQEQLAPMLGMSARLVGEIERGRGTVGFEKVLLACKTLGMDLYVRSR